MTSADGITWSQQTVAGSNTWTSVVYGGPAGQEKFVAVASNASNRVLTSADGITWTAQSVPLNTWNSVTYGDGVFVAVASAGVSDYVMTSADGLTWTSQVAASSSTWNSVTYGGGIFVAVASAGVSGLVMTSGSMAGPVLDPSLWTNYYQALPMPGSGVCSDISPEQNTLAAYGTGVTGGWVKGWEPWVNAGQGGWACRRMLTNTGGNTWRVGA